MGWIDKRAIEDAGTPELWELLCIHIEQAVCSYGGTDFARQHNLIGAIKRIGNCIHVIRASASSNRRERSMDVCLDQDARRVFSRKGDREHKFLRIGVDPQDNVCLVGVDGKPVSNDEASRFFLEDFLFSAQLR